jgi:hypothetical protein
MNYEYKIDELINDLNETGPDTKGFFKLRVRNYKNNRYPREIKISLMFILKELEYSPEEVISHCFILLPSMNIEKCYEIFYKDVFNYIVFCRSDMGSEYTNFKGKKVKIQSVSDWLLKG